MGTGNHDLFGRDQFSASTSFDYSFEAARGRLDSVKQENLAGAWMPRMNDKEQWIQVDLKHPEFITGVVTQGRPSMDHWVTKYTVLTSIDGIDFTPYTRSGETATVVFTGNSDRNTKVRGLFDREIIARYVRIQPQEWNGMIALRFDVLSCSGLTSGPATIAPPGVSGSPTAVPPGISGSPTVIPPGVSGSPTAVPPGVSGSPTAVPPGVSGSPTAVPPGVSGSPTAVPPGVSGSPTAVPPGVSGSPTAVPPGVSGSPTAVPPGVSGSPTAVPPGVSGSPTAVPPGVSGSPTAVPPGVSGSPTAVPPGVSGSPTPSPKAGISGIPTPKAGISGSPTAVPPGVSGSPTAVPPGVSGSPTAVPPGVSGSPTPSPKEGISGIPTPKTGISGSPTAVPPGASGSPTAVPPGVSGSPTAVPPGVSGSPTAVPPGVSGSPTAIPPGASGSPTAVPPGVSGSPTAVPSGVSGSPTAVPPGVSGSPTAVPPGVSGSPTAVPPGVSGSPTAVPPGVSGSPTAVPPGVSGSPTAIPPGVSGSPTAVPPGVSGSPTAVPPGVSSNVVCSQPMGIDNALIVKDTQITASGFSGNRFNAPAGRLFNEFGAWSPKENNGDQWIMVNFLKPQVLNGILTQGSSISDKWVTQFIVSYSTDGFTFTPIKDSATGKSMIFTGNSDRNTVMKNIFPEQVTVQYIKITPIAWSPAGIGMRFNLLGCYKPSVQPTLTPSAKPTVSPVFTMTTGVTMPEPSPVSTLEPVCTIPMGVENYRIVGESQLTASSKKDKAHGPIYARINQETDEFAGSWVPAPTDKTPWIQVDFLEPKTVSGVITQGSGKDNSWLETYKVSYSFDGKTFTDYTDTEGKPAKVFNGNSDSKTPVPVLFNRDITARFVRIVPLTSHGETSLRFNILGCNPSPTNPLIPTTAGAPTASPPVGGKSGVPTASPSGGQSGQPTASPSAGQSGQPTASPSAGQSGQPTASPSAGQSSQPTASPVPELTTPSVCLIPMGIENSYFVSNSQLTSSSSLDAKHSAAAGRLYTQGAWTPSSTDKQWIQVDFLKPTLISGVMTQGSPEAPKWVTKYNVFYGFNGHDFSPYTRIPGGSTPEVFEGNMDQNTPIRNLFNRDITARYVRIVPVEWSKDGIAMRFNILGCTPPQPKPPTVSPGVPTASPPFGQSTQGPFLKCDVPMGIENPGLVGDRQLTASSSLNQFTGAERARPYTQKDGAYSGGWIPKYTDTKQWIEVDFGASYAIAGVSTQGRSDGAAWVTKYEVYYSNDGRTFNAINTSPTDTVPRVFEGNFDQNTPLMNVFPEINARFIRIRPVEWHEAIGMRFNVYGCQLPSATPSVPTGLTVPTAIPTAAPTVSPVVTAAPSTSSCMYWTPWVNSNTPDTNGEYESFWDMMTVVKICDTKYVKKMECRTATGKIPFDQTGETGVMCNLDTKSLVCMNTDQTGGKTCSDYEIRVFCDECGKPTAAPSVKSYVPTASPKACDNKWSDWINRHEPDGVGEIEKVTKEDLDRHCAGGSVGEVECQTVKENMAFYLSGDIVTCDAQTGLSCKHSDNTPMKCHDYKIRFKCQCEGAPTAKPPTSGTEVPSTATCTTSQWSPWINQDKPGVGGGDYEKISPELEKQYCSGGTLTKIECMTVDGIEYYSSGEVMQCTMAGGSSCSNADNFPMPCSDYQIRYFCECTTPVTTGAPTASPGTGVSGTPTASPVIGGSGAPTASPVIGGSGAPTASPVIGGSGTPTVSPGIGKSSKPTASPGIGESGTPTSSPGIGQSGTPTASPGTTSCTKSQWTPWVNNDKPTTGEGDHEVLSGSQMSQYCAGGRLAKIECRTVDGIEYFSSGDIMKCDLTNGALCKNEDNFPIKCQDYEVRYYCDCPTPTASPVPVKTNLPTATPPQSSTGVPSASPEVQCTNSQWSSWINRDHPNVGDGDYESMTVEELTKFCPGGKITEVKCETVDAIPSYSSGELMTCDKHQGVVCRNEDNFPMPCSDYRIMYYCQCAPTASPPTGTAGTPTSSPSAGQSGIPTAGPSAGQTGKPTATPGVPGQSSVPTASPSAGQTGKPTATPGVPGQSSVPTASPSAGLSGQPTASPTVTSCSQSHYSNWVNRDLPESGNGDHEAMTPDELSSFCKGGQVTKIECYTDDIPSYSSGELVTCDMKSGLTCNNADNAPVPCSDYKVRYFCDCSGTPQVTLTPPNKNIAIRCDWSPWINTDTPDSGHGDMETIESIKTKHGVCKNMKQIECRIAGTNTMSSAAGQSRVTCDVDNGLRCYNNEQLSSKCYDYEVRVLCWEDTCQGPIPTAGPTAGPHIHTTGSVHVPTATAGTSFSTVAPLERTTTAVCPPGEMWNACAHTCDQLCNAVSGDICDGTNPQQCVPGCKDETITVPKCADGERLNYNGQCVKAELCPCKKPDGTFAQPFEFYKNPVDECSMCHCFNNAAVCTKDDSCVPTAGPSVQPTIQPECHWTNWINVDKPTTGDGDVESILKLRTTNTFCAHPVSIECREASSKTPAMEFGQKVTCDLTTGFTCYNWENSGKCGDYEVRFYCPCASTVSPSTGQSGQPSASPSGQSSQPTASPSSGQPGQPTASPSGQSGQPTASPSGQSGQPTASPISGQPGQPTASPSGQSGQPTASPSTRQSGQPSASPSSGQPGQPTVSPPFCGWSAWTNSDHPDVIVPNKPFEGDIESIASLMTKTTVCSHEMMKKVECRVASTKQTASAAGQSVTCDAIRGLRCNNLKQKDGKCLDYEMRVFCDCSALPTARPSTGSSGVPTASPSVTGKSGQPTASPSAGGLPTASPGVTGKSGQPTASPSAGQSGQPTASPGVTPKGGVPSASPSAGQSGQPTASPSAGGLPTASPSAGQSGQPTASPSAGQSGQPTSSPGIGQTGLPTAAPTVCGWTQWMNSNTPDNTGEMELLPSLRQQFQFCNTEDITALECRDSKTQKSVSESGQIGVTCDMKYSGLMCSNSKQMVGSTCFDYEVRVLCEPKGVDCSKVPTASPSTRQSGQPTASPSAGQSGQPTSSPVVGQSGLPTASPSAGQSGIPTSRPSAGQSGQPTVSPSAGQSGQPTASLVVTPKGGVPSASPSAGQSAQPTASPSAGQSGQPTASPGVTPKGGVPSASPSAGQSAQPTASPSAGQSGIPTSSPSAGQSGQPTVSPSAGQSGQPTASPGVTPKGGVPSASPSAGQSAQPTASPSAGQSGRPTASPSAGQSGQPTAIPVVGQTGLPTGTPSILGQPSVSPSLGPSGIPTASPSAGQSGQPTASPSAGGLPTASPGVTGKSGQPTASPSAGQSGQPTASPSAGQSGKPTSSPSAGQSGQPTASPSAGQSGQPTASLGVTPKGGVPSASPSAGQSAQPTASPSAGQSGKPTSSPSAGQSGQPTASPSAGQSGQPTASPGVTPKGGVPSASPSAGQSAQPTASPGVTVKSGQPTASPGVTPKGGVPSASPSAGQSAQPTASPGVTVKSGQPTASPSAGQSGQPTASPSAGGLPTASPGVTGKSGQPTASPSAGQSAQPTASPSAGQSGLPTASPVSGSSFSVAPGMETTAVAGQSTTAVLICPNPMTNTATLEVPDSHLSASSSLSTYAGPQRSRIDAISDNLNIGAWMPKTMDKGQWIEARFDHPEYVNAIITKGREGSSQWVKAFIIAYSMDGQTFQYYEKNGTPKVFNGNFDGDSAVRSVLTPIVAKYIRIQPVMWEGAIALRFSIVGCRAPEEVLPTLVPSAGPSVGPTASPQQTCVTSSWSSWVDTNTATEGQHEFMTKQQLTDFCSTGKVDKVECETVDGIPSYSTGEIMQCSVENGLVCNDQDNFPIPCSDYRIRYHCDCSGVPTASPPSQTGSGLPTASPGQGVSGTPTASPGIQLTASPTPNIPAGCKEDMGMANGFIRNDMISASSYRDGLHSAISARLGGNSAWLAAEENKKQYIQVDFLAPRIITGVTTQGRPTAPSYVTSYKVFYSYDGANWNAYRETKGEDMVFSGNFDNETPVTNMFMTPVRARYIRISPQTWSGMMALRFEIHGCFESYPTVSPTPVNPLRPSGKPIGSSTTTPGQTVTPFLPAGCVIWDSWVNLGQVTLTSNGDREPIDEVKKASLTCQQPMRIECRTATPDHTASGETGQTVTCNLWKGLVCNNADQKEPMCFDYEVRLGCLKQTKECLSEIPTATPTAGPSVAPTFNANLIPCYTGMDLSQCPKEGCSSGFFCDGVRCVRKAECPCMIDGQVVLPGQITQNSNCDTCQCVSGEVKCLPKTCPDCKEGLETILDKDTCECECEACATGDFRCGNGQCIPNSARCDGVADCTTDEFECASTPIFTLPTTAKPSPTMPGTTTPTFTTQLFNDVNTTRHKIVTTSVAPNTTVHLPPHVPTPTACVDVTCSPLVQPPLNQGEVAKVMKSPDGCCEEYIVVCEPRQCPKISRDCMKPEILTMVDSGDRCCPEYTCVCPPKCPVPTQPPCAFGSQVVDIVGGCNCTTKACVAGTPSPFPVVTTTIPTPICRYSMTKMVTNGKEVDRTNPVEVTHTVGQQWADGLCKTCQCVNSTSGTAETTCREKQCPVCKLGEERRQTDGTCCGECVKIGCVVNGTVYKTGEKIQASMKCFEKMCTVDVMTGDFIVLQTQVQCENIDKLPKCTGSEKAYDSTGCCLRCVPRDMVPTTSLNSVCKTCTPRLMFGQIQQSIGFFKVNDNGEICSNVEPIPELKECAGYCGSTSKYTALMRGFDNDCMCCQPAKTVPKTIQLVCGTGRKITKTYNVPETCACSACSQGA
ncbi:mucin-5AC-like [Haliotis asinina]|uniref:mucin-5AC-like n=1 Tax=Haliotis asinina TaxID=109174 RepID=UPI0035321049